MQTKPLTRMVSKFGKKQNTFKPNVFKFASTFHNFVSDRIIDVDFEKSNQNLYIYVPGFVSAY